MCQASSVLQREYLADPQASCSHLLGYTLLSAAVDACPLFLTADYRGHEIMFAVAPETAFDTPTLELARAFHPDEPTRGHLGRHRSFFYSGKATRFLAWTYGSHRSFRSADRSVA